MPASSTLEASFGSAAAQFAYACEVAAADATALFRVIYGLADGNDYGRYFVGQDPLVQYQETANSLDGLIATNVALLAAVNNAAAGLLAAQTDPTQFYTAGSALTEAVRASCANPADAIRLLSGLVRFQALAPNDPVAGDPLGVEIDLLTKRAAHALRLAAASSLIRATSLYVPTSQEDALKIRDEVADLLDDLALFCADIFDDASASALTQARAAIIEDFNARGASAPGAQTIRFNGSMPALVMAYRLYDDVTREGDLVGRNNPVDPNFMPVRVEALLS